MMATSTEVKTLWLGDLDPWMDEKWVTEAVKTVAKPVNVKIIKDKVTGLPADFSSHAEADKVLNTLNGKPIPNTSKKFKMNWGSLGAGKTEMTTTTPTASSILATKVAAPVADFSIYVGDLDHSVTDQDLHDFFSKKFGSSIVSAKVITDPVTRICKGYGFVKFSNFEDSQRAIKEMYGALLRGRPIKTSQSYTKGGSAADPATILQSPGLQNNPYYMMYAQMATNPMLYYQQMYSQMGYNPAMLQQYYGQMGAGGMPTTQGMDQSGQAMMAGMDPTQMMQMQQMQQLQQMGMMGMMGGGMTGMPGMQGMAGMGGMDQQQMMKMMQQQQQPQQQTTTQTPTTQQMSDNTSTGGTGQIAAFKEALGTKITRPEKKVLVQYQDDDEEMVIEPGEEKTDEFIRISANHLYTKLNMEILFE